MTEKVAEKIIKATCSQTFQKAIAKTNFEFADFDLLVLTYKHAPDHETRLDLLQLIEANTNDDKVKAQARKCIDYKKANLEKFLSIENNCIFEAKIKDKPDACEERYIAQTFESIINVIQSFCTHYEVEFSQQSRFSITKRKLLDVNNANEFKEDWRGEADYKGNFIMVDVSHEELRDRTVLAENRDCGDKDCDECEHRPCMLYYAPKLPPFLKNSDLVCYADSEGVRHYSVFFGEMTTSPTDDCAYLIQLYDNAICNKTIKTKDQFFERIFNLHEHIEFPRLDIVKIAEVPDGIKKTYKTYLKLYNRFGKDSE